MASNFLICLNAIAPLLIYLMMGFIIRRLNVLTLDEVHSFNKLVYKLFFPVLMFNTLYTSDVAEAFDAKIVTFGVVFLFVFLALEWAVIVRIIDNDKSRGATIQAIYRSNYVLMGIPVAVNLFGKGNIPDAAVLTTVIVPLYNVIAVFLLEHFRGGRASIRALIKGVSRNSILIGAVIGAIALLIGLKLPFVIEQVCDKLDSTTAPIAMILLGATFNVKSVKTGRRSLVIALVGKLIVQPAVGLPIAVLLGFRDVQLVTLIIMMSAPVAVSSYTMADAMDSDGDLAANAVIFSTPISCITMFLWLFLFKSIGLF